MGHDELRGGLHDAGGRAIPPLLLGTARLGSADPTGWFDREARRRAFAVLDDMFQAGCRALDLARAYRAGGTERVVGEWLSVTGVRDELFLVSKGAHPLPILAPRRVHPTAIEADLDATLRALRVDRVDLFLVHRDHEAASLPAVAASLAAVRARGLARYTGVSNWTFERLAQLASYAEVVHASSPQLSLAAWRAPPWPGCWSVAGRERRDERRRYARAGLPTLAYCPLSRGFFDAKERRAGAFHGPANIARRERVRALAKRRSARSAPVTPSQVALAYLWSLPFPVYPVVGCRRPDHMRANLAAAGLTLDAATRRWLESGGAAPWEADLGRSCGEPGA